MDFSPNPEVSLNSPPFTLMFPFLSLSFFFFPLNISISYYAELPALGGAPK